jgi:hypothetical protein
MQAVHVFLGKIQIQSNSWIADKFHFGINRGGNRIAFENFRSYNQFKINNELKDLL